VSGNVGMSKELGQYLIGSRGGYGLVLQGSTICVTYLFAISKLFHAKLGTILQLVYKLRTYLQTIN